MKKIMFDDKFGLTKAVLDGSKTQTRRIMKGKPLTPSDEIESAGVLGDEVQIIANGGENLITMKLPFRVGEVVAVAQSYKDAINPIDWVSMKLYEGTSGWNNKMFVRAELMPHRIRITDVRVERLQDISDEDCINEGIVKDTCKTYFNGYTAKFSLDQYNNMLSSEWFRTPREAFAHLINKVSRKDVWNLNPYVFVYDFELVKS